jgi:hypothetical protein
MTPAASKATEETPAMIFTFLDGFRDTILHPHLAYRLDLRIARGSHLPIPVVQNSVK